MLSFSRRFAAESLAVSIVSLLFFCTFTGSATADTPRLIDERDRLVLHGNVNPLAQSQFEIGRTDPGLPMERMILSLSLRAGAQPRLERLLAQQHDPASPLYHHWLTPEEFGARFGPTRQELQLVTGWLQEHGFTIDEVAKGRGWINFSGTAHQVEETFATEMHDYNVDGKLRHANATDPSMPRAFAGLVNGIVSLHNFPLHANHGTIRSVALEELNPDFNGGTDDYIAPADFATIHDLNSVYSAGTTGSGRTIAIVGRTDIQLADVQFFRNLFGLPANDPVFIHNGDAPGDAGGNDELESLLDVEWSGAVAPSATIQFVVSKTTTTTDGVALSAQYVVNNNLADAMSTSYGQCEASLGSSGRAFYNSIWSQAAAQGITAFVSAGCNAHNPTAGHDGYLIIKGHTASAAGLYSISGTSASSPSFAGLLALVAQKTGRLGSVDGAALINNLPIPGLTLSASPAAVSLAPGSSGTSTVLTAISGGFNSALVLAASGQPSGVTVSFNPASIAAPGTGISTMKMAVSTATAPGTYPITLTATGGGVTRTATVALTVTAVPGFALTASPASISVVQGSNGSLTLSSATFGGFNSALSFSASGQPTSILVTFGPAALAAPGAGSSTVTLTVSPSTAAGTYPVYLTTAGGGITHTAIVTLKVSAVPPN